MRYLSRHPGFVGRVVLLLAIGLWMARPLVSADPEAAREEYLSILREARQGEPREALEKLEAFARAHPDDPKADDALLEAARLAEERLADYDRAIALYREILDRHPDARGARRAQRRIEALAAERAGGDEALRRYKGILRDYAALGADEAVRRMERLVEEFPGLGPREQALYWIGEQHHRARRHREAARWYERVVQEYPGGELAYQATKGLGDLYAEYLDDLDRAEGYYAALADFRTAVPYAEEVSRSLLARVKEYRTLRRGFHGALAIVALAVGYLILGIDWRRRVAQLRRSSMAVLLVYTVVALAMAAVLYGRSPVYARGLLLLIPATLAVTLLDRLYLAGRVLSASRKVGHFFVMFLLILAVQYAVFYRSDLVILVWDLLHEGPR